MTAGRKPPAAKQPAVQPQKNCAADMPKGEQRLKQRHQQLPAERRQPMGNVQQKRPMQKPFAFAGGPPAMQQRQSAPLIAGQTQQQRHQAAGTTSDGKRFTNQLPKQTKAVPAAAAAAVGPSQPSPGQPTRKRAEGGRKRRKKG